MAAYLKGVETNGVVEFSLKDDAKTNTTVIRNNGIITTIRAAEILEGDGFTADSTVKKLIIGSDVKELETRCFQNCAGLTGSLTIPNSVYTIAGNAFQNCSGLTGNLNIPSSVKYLKRVCFDGCSGFTGTLTFEGSNIDIINEYTFRDCTGFTGSLTIPDSVTRIERDAFNNCGGFTGDLVIPDGVEYLGARCFQNAGFDGTLTLPSTLKEIYISAFFGTSYTGDLVIPEGVESIGNTSFRDSAFTNSSLTIPSTVTYVGNGAFRNSGFSELYINCPAAIFNNPGPVETRNTFLDMSNLTNIYVDYQYFSEYTTEFSQTTANVSFYNLPLTPTIFYDNNNIEIGSITTDIPANFIGAGQNPNIFYISIGTTCTSIGENAFSNGPLGGDLIIPLTVTDLFNNCFRNCFNITSLTLNEGLINIGEGAFSLNEQFTNTVVTIPNSVETIGIGSFYQCTNLTSVTIGTGVQTIGPVAFLGCSSLTTFNCYVSKTIVDAATQILDNCTSLTEIHVRSSDASWTAGPGLVIGNITVEVIKDL